MIGTIAVDLPERDPIKVGIGISGSSGSSRESSLYCSGNDLVLSRSSNDGWNDGIDRVTRAYPSRSNESADKHSKMHSGSRCHTIPSNVRTAWTPFKFPTPLFCKFLQTTFLYGGHFLIMESTQVRCILLSNLVSPAPSLNVTCAVPCSHSMISTYLSQFCRTQRCKSRLRYKNGSQLSRRGDGIILHRVRSIPET